MPDFILLNFDAQHIFYCIKKNINTWLCWILPNIYGISHGLLVKHLKRGAIVKSKNTGEHDVYLMETLKKDEADILCQFKLEFQVHFKYIYLKVHSRQSLKIDLRKIPLTLEKKHAT